MVPGRIKEIKGNGSTGPMACGDHSIRVTNPEVVKRTDTPGLPVRASWSKRGRLWEISRLEGDFSILAFIRLEDAI